MARTRAVAAFTWGKNTDWTHPVSMPTTARRGPRAATCSGSRTAADGGGASFRAAPSAGDSRPGRLLRASFRSSPVRCTAFSGPVTARSRRGYGNSEKIAVRAARSRSRAARPARTEGASGVTGAGSDRASSVQTRAASMSWSYCTPDGQAVMHAMQPRQRSKCSAAAGVSSAPSRIWLTR